MGNEGAVTGLLRRYNSGDRSAWEELIPILYEDLRRVARQRLRFDRKSQTLGTTALVNECYLRLVQNRDLGIEDRNAFLAAASLTMRRVLVDYARTRNREKRGGGQESVPIQEVEEWLTLEEGEELLGLDEALDRLRAMNGRAAQVIELRFFGGLSLDETAQVMEVSTTTVRRMWTAARAWLRKEMGVR